jgi:hypothetical protein
LHFFYKIFEIHDESLLLGYENHELLALGFLEKLYCADEGPHEFGVIDDDTTRETLVI